MLPEGIVPDGKALGEVGYAALKDRHELIAGDMLGHVAVQMRHAARAGPEGDAQVLDVAVGVKQKRADARKAGIEMPTFCYYSDLSVHGACRMCIVEDVKTGKIDASCSMEPRDGMEIRTNTDRKSVV